jgi:Fe-S-cluster-containing dehydrogenase component/formate-dependent nitrite reductase membrane component NrfD
VTTFAWVIDQTSCIGCHACTTACKSENDVPLGVFRTWVKYVETGTFPATRRQIAVLRCNHCAEPPCVEICPTGAMFQRPDGIVDFDTGRCIACKACLQACPYDAIYIDPEDHVAEKCNFCSHRVDRGLLPACVVVCPTESLVFGDLDDPRSRVSQLVASRPTTVRRPEQNTRPKTFYIGAAEAVLDPLAAPREDRYLWSDRRQVDGDAELAKLTRWRRPGAEGVGGPRLLPVVAPATAAAAPPPNTVRRPPATPDAPIPGTSRAAGPPPARTGPPSEARPVAHVAYDVDHPRPWGTAVAAYLWTKGLAAGPFGILAAAGLAADPGGGLAPLLVGGVSLVGLGLTALLLVADLGRPERFWRILLAPQLRSWLAIGAYILVAYGGLLGLWLLATAAGLDPAVRGPLGGLAAVGAFAAALYTAFLFGQCEARDLWQTPLVGLVLLAQATLLGGVVLVAVAAVLGGSTVLVGPGRLALLVGGLGHLVALVGGEALARHPTPNARAAAHLLVRGRHRAAFWLGGVVGGGLLPIVAALALGDAVLPLAGAGLVAAAALLWYEAGFVAAGQAVPIS